MWARWLVTLEAVICSMYHANTTTTRTHPINKSMVIRYSLCASLTSRARRLAASRISQRLPALADDWHRQEAYCGTALGGAGSGITRSAPCPSHCGLGCLP